MKSLSQILEEAPDIPGYGGGKWAMCSVHCCWWTSNPEHLGNTNSFSAERTSLAIHHGDGSVEHVPVPGLPCCPHCGSVLTRAPLEKFVEIAKKNERHYGTNGLAAFGAAHSSNSDTCHRYWDHYKVEEEDGG